MIDRDAAGRGRARLTRPRHRLQRQPVRNERGVIARAGQRDQPEVALEHDRLRLARHAREAEPARPQALRHHPFPTQRPVLADRRDQRVEIARIGHRAAHCPRVGDRMRARRRRRSRPPPRAGRSRRSPRRRAPWSARRAGWTRTLASSRARRRMKSTTAGSSTGGLVSGRVTSVVTPPAAAAALALAMVSRCSAPGSPTKARMSIRPGATTSPSQSTTRASAGNWSRVTLTPTPAMISSMTMSPPQRLGLLNGIDETRVEEGDRRRWRHGPPVISESGSRAQGRGVSSCLPRQKRLDAALPPRRSRRRADLSARSSAG